MPPSRAAKNCWQKKTVLKKTLVLSVTALGIVAIILLVVLLPKRKEDFCRSTKCLNATAKVLEPIDREVDPCDDFYKFACGNYIKKYGHDPSQTLFKQMLEKRKDHLLEIYSEEGDNEDHRMVKVAKNLFKKCLNEEEIERNKLRTIKDVLWQVGGWPVMDGRSWDETKFDWLNATYKLRQLGYPYQIFLGLNVKPDEHNKTKYRIVLDWTLPDDKKKKTFNDSLNIDKMVETAMIFGAPDFRDEIYREMKEAYEFGQNLNDGHDVYHIYTQDMTVESFQRRVKENINLLNFINTIVGPKLAITNDEVIIIQRPENLDGWFNRFQRAPKRTVANYMMWNLIEKLISYLTKNLNVLVHADQEGEARAEFCLKEVEKRFILSPMEIMYCRKYITNDIKLEIEEIMTNNRNQFIKMVGDVEWLDDLDKQEIIGKAKTAKFIIGQNGSCFDENLLNELDVDMIETKSQSFLSLLAQATRNHETAIYSKIKRLTNADFYEIWNPANNPGYIQYSAFDNVIYVPVVATNGFIFQTGRPNYLNYRGLTGVIFFNIVVKHELSRKTKDHVTVIGKCMEKQLNSSVQPFKQVEFTAAFPKMFGEQVSYEAYATWEKIHGTEPALTGLDYNWQQLFWIRSTICQTGNFSEFDIFNVPEFVSNVDFLSRSNNPTFAKDFGCPVGSRMNPVEKCTLMK